MNPIVSGLPFAPAMPATPAAGATSDAVSVMNAQLPPAMQVAFASVLSRAMKPAGTPDGTVPVTPVDVTGAFESLCETLAAAVGAISVPNANATAETSATDALRALVTRVAGEQPTTLDPNDEPEPIGRVERHRADEHDRTTDADRDTRAAATIDPTLVVRDLSALQPDFRAKLDRVVSRMKDEYGHDVTVAETWRSQTRQDHLHEQGRSRPGAIVTWTHRSQHTDGRAADLIVDGKWDNADGYAHLMQVAEQEGLQTLGARDPGHVALTGAQPAAAKLLATIADAATITDVGVTPSRIARTGDTIVDTTRASGVRRAGTSPVIDIAPGVRVANGTPIVDVAPTVRRAAPIVREDMPAQVGRIAAPAPVASVAQVAPIAQVAQVASVAAVATPGDASTRDSADRDDRRRDTRSARAADSTAVADRAHPLADADRTAPDVRTFASTAARHSGASVAALAPELVRGANAGTRTEQVLALQDAKSAQPMSHMLLRMDNGNGGEDRIRVDVRGTTVGATIDVRDPDAAAQLAARMPDLTRALESRGLEADALRVRAASTTGVLQQADIARAVAAIGEPTSPWRSGLFTDSASPSNNSRHGSSDQRSQQDPSRHRSRREQQGDQP